MYRYLENSKFGTVMASPSKTAMEWRQRGGGSNGLRGVLEISPSAKTLSEWTRLQCLVLYTTEHQSL